MRISKTITGILADHRKTLPYEKLSKYQRIKILLEEQQHRCAKCGQGEIWKRLKLVLQMDHIDGDPNNHSRDNEWMLCPNCHSQMPTYCRMSPEEKQMHQQKVTTAMRAYGHQRRAEAMKKSPWKGKIKHSDEELMTLEIIAEQASK